MESFLRLNYSTAFRFTVAMSCVSGRRFIMENFEPTEVEMIFLKMVKCLSTGTDAEYEPNSGVLRFTPGDFNKRNVLEFNIGTEVSIGYFAEPLLIIALFARNSTSVKFEGATNDHFSFPSVEGIINGILPLLSRFGVHGIRATLKRRDILGIGNSSGCFKIDIPTKRFNGGLNSLQVDESGGVKSVDAYLFTMCSPAEVMRRLGETLASDLFNAGFPSNLVTLHRESIGPGRGIPVEAFGLTLVLRTLNDSYISVDKSISPAMTYADVSANTPDRLPGILVSELSGLHTSNATSSQKALLIVLASLTPFGQTSKIKVGKLTVLERAVIDAARSVLGVNFRMNETSMGYTTLTCRGCTEQVDGETRVRPLA